MNEGQLRELMGEWRQTATDLKLRARRSSDGIGSLKFYAIADMLESLASDVTQLLDQKPQESKE